MGKQLLGGGVNGEPVRDQILLGEDVAVRSRQVLSRRGRSGVRVRVVGGASLAWVEAAEAWGCGVEAVVVGSSRELSEVIHLVSLSTTTTVSEALLLPPVSNWNGLLLSTVCSAEDAALVFRMFENWQPWIAIVAFPSDFTRRKMAALIPAINSKYSRRLYTIKHHQVGGVTSSVWHIGHWNRMTNQACRPSLMTMEFFPRPLQTALDDTKGGRLRSQIKTFETQGDSANEIVGTLQAGSSRETRVVYSATKVGPDISRMQTAERRFWVEAATVMSPCPMIRQVNLEELHGMWDYEGKLELKSWGLTQGIKILHHRLLSPPAKIIRIFLSKAADVIVEQVMGSRAQPLLDKHDMSPTQGLTQDVPFASMEAKMDTRATATQADDAQVDLSTWALPNETPEQAKAREVLRRFAAKWWAYNLSRKAWKWWQEHGKRGKDAAAIADCLRRAKACTYWEWVRGSRIHFWMFPEEFQEEFRDGTEFFHLSAAPKGMVHNLPAPSREAELEARKKVFKLKFQWHLEKKFVSLCVPRFSIVKVLVDGVVTDIRVIWDSKSNGHNATLWAPSFMLDDCGDVEEHVVKWLAIPMGQYLEQGSPPQDYTRTDCSYIKSKQGDVDVGGMFHNFLAHQNERENLGVRWIETQNDGSMERHEFLRFTVLTFGGKSSPYLACQAQARILEACMGNRRDPSNCWQWDRVHLNLPCADDYDASLPRVLLLRKDGKMATRQATFVDDIHPSGRDEGDDEHTKMACKQLKSRMNSRGNRAEDRKYRPPSFTPGAWNGVVIHTDTPFPRKSTTLKKWMRMREGLDWIWSVAQESDVIETGRLRRFAGLAVHVTEVYRDARSYLKGIFNAIESFRWNRDLYGWRLRTAMEAAAMLELDDADIASSAVDYPVETRITSELLMHVEALRSLFAAETPHSVPIRPTDKWKNRYYLGDASAEGFGSGMQYPDMVLDGRVGLWMAGYAEGGSNVREGTNMTNHLLEDIKAGKHDGCEVWCFTDNSVWSYVWTKGLSTARHLFYLVLDLRIAAREHEVYIRTCHLSGNRMIATGMDGWSRGNHDAGLSLGFDVRQYIPLHLSAWRIAGGALEGWCKSWMGSDYSPPLTAEGWFEEGHQAGVHIWAPPPAATLIALKELARSRQKRPYTTTHVVIVPRLLYQEEWRSRFEKEVDLWFVFHNGSVWPHSAFEPLMVGIRFPLSRSYPWELKQDRERMVGLGRTMSEVSKACNLRVGDHLRKLWQVPRPVSSV